MNLELLPALIATQESFGRLQPSAFGTYVGFSRLPRCSLAPRESCAPFSFPCKYLVCEACKACKNVTCIVRDLSTCFSEIAAVFVALIRIVWSFPAIAPVWLRARRQVGPCRLSVSCSQEACKMFVFRQSERLNRLHLAYSINKCTVWSKHFPCHFVCVYAWVKMCEIP